MHEMSLTEGVVKILEDQAKAHGFAKVKTVWLEIGALSNVEPESMEFCFGAVAKQSPVACDAVLQIVTIPGQAACLDCGSTVEIAQRYDPCPKCGGFGLKVIGGTEMKIKELEVE